MQRLTEVSTIGVGAKVFHGGLSLATTTAGDGIFAGSTSTGSEKSALATGLVVSCSLQVSLGMSESLNAKSQLRLDRTTCDSGFSRTDWGQQKQPELAASSQKISSRPIQEEEEAQMASQAKQSPP